MKWCTVNTDSHFMIFSFHFTVYLTDYLALTARAFSSYYSLKFFIIPFSYILLNLDMCMGFICHKYYRILVNLFYHNAPSHGNSLAMQVCCKFADICLSVDRFLEWGTTQFWMGSALRSLIFFFSVLRSQDRILEFPKPEYPLTPRTWWPHIARSHPRKIEAKCIVSR